MVDEYNARMDALHDGKGRPYPPDVLRGRKLLGHTIRRARERKGWTQLQLARRCGLTQSTISRLETGTLQGLRWARLARVIAALEGVWPPYAVDDGSPHESMRRLLQ